MGLFRQWLQQRCLASLVLATFLFCLSFSIWHTYTKSQPQLLDQPGPNVADELCDSLRDGLQDVFLILRTGANEAFEKLPPHFNTTLRCLDSDRYGIWSDFEEEIQGYPVRNALQNISPDIMAAQRDFDYYRRLQAEGRASFTAEELQTWATARNDASGRDTPGWRLDKWKFLPIAEAAYRQNPDAKWFVFMETDTYISWSNTLRWLSHLDATKSYYLGREMQIGDVIFAYGGSGIILSNPAMKALTTQLASVTPGYYEEWTGTQWAGDCVLGKALKDVGVDLSWQAVNFFDRSPSETDYSVDIKSNNLPLWCHYVTTYHHTNALDIEEHFKFEAQWNRDHNSTILRHRDIFRSLILPKIDSRVEEWINGAEDDKSVMATFEDCRNACEASQECIQFTYSDQTQVCKTSKGMRLGHRDDSGSSHNERATSGWMVDRVHTLMAVLDQRCTVDHTGWILPP